MLGGYRVEPQVPDLVGQSQNSCTCASINWASGYGNAEEAEESNQLCG